MTKSGKKKARRLKRSIRRTLGTLFLISALVVAAIPVDNLQAASEGSGIAGQNARAALQDPPSKTPERGNETKIPQITNSDKIYTTENEKLEFAYVSVPTATSGNSTWAVVIVGFGGGFVEGETLEIPNKVDAYRQYTANQGQNANYVAVGRNGNFLFYRATEPKTYTAYITETKTLDQALAEIRNSYTDVMVDESYTVDQETGKVTMSVNQEKGNLIPCYKNDKSDWENLDKSRFYYDKNNDTGNQPAADLSKVGDFAKAGSEKYERISGAMVNYIGNQWFDTTIDASTNKAKGWTRVDAGSKSKGVFAGSSNIVNLRLGKDFDFKGIGDYAFYNSGVTTIDLENLNGLSAIGEGAFEGCLKLQSVKLNANSPITALGAYAFKGCRSLTSFSMPWFVETIGDSAFADCDLLQTIELCKPNDVCKLHTLGKDVFSGCSALTSVTFPDTCETPIYLSTFKGCSSLRFVCGRSKTITFPEDTAYRFSEFKEMLGEGTKINGEFYFAGLEGFDLHDMCKENFFAFNYINTRDLDYSPQDRYELTVLDMESDDSLNPGKNIFVVTSKNELYKYSYEGKVKSLTIPAKIGPYSIKNLKDEVFANSCNLETVVIPSTVESVGARAFQGCHNLTNVIFESFDIERGDNVTVGQDAFQTQKFMAYAHDEGCRGVDTDGYTPVKKLNFTGPISFEFGPYAYAMSERGRYNNDDSRWGVKQETSYITYYTGWPRNLEIQYNPELRMSELVNFPTLAELADYSDKYSQYKYLSLPNALKDENGKTAYRRAMEEAYAQYKGGSIQSGTPVEEVVNAALHLVIPDGVQSVKEGLIRGKQIQDRNEGALNITPKKVTAYSLVEIKSGEIGEYTYNTSDSADMAGFDAEKITDSGQVAAILAREGTDPDDPTASGGSATYNGVMPGTGTFAGARYLEGVYLLKGTNGAATVIDDYAFQDCEKLNDVSIADNISKLGVCPFYGCDSLKSVNFQNSPYFKCENSIIYTLATDGSRVSIVECLGGRSDFIEPMELSGISKLEEAAFKGSNVLQVDLSRTMIDTIPKETFADTASLTKIVFPSTLQEIDDYAFRDCAVKLFNASNASNTLNFVSQYAFADLLNDNSEVTWICEEGAERIGRLQNFIISHQEGESTYTVIFRDWDSELGYNRDVDKVAVTSGQHAKPPTPAGKDGMLFSHWDLNIGGIYTDDYKVNANLVCTAQYEPAPAGYGKFTVSFYSYDNATLLKTVYVSPGESAESEAPSAPAREGYVFVGWDRSISNITKDTDTAALYRAVYGDEHTVRYFVDGNLYHTAVVRNGENAPNISVEDKKGVTWVPSLNNIVKDTDFTAVYDSDNSGDNNDDKNKSTEHIIRYYVDGKLFYQTTVKDGENAPNLSVSGKTGITWVPSLEKITKDTDFTAIYGSNSVNGNGNNGTNNNNTGSSNGTGSNNGTGSSNGTFYTLTVRNGSGSGSYVAGSQVIIYADDPESGQEFSSWTIEPSETKIVSKVLSATIINMPAENVTVTANYKAKSTSSDNGGSGGNGGSSTSNNRPSGSTGTTTNGGTTVVIDKNGLSNTGVVSATVNGSSDNFTIKVAENSAAAAAVLAALLAEYGSIDNIVYFPMDISLYDSTGTTKITDTTGLSVTITLPLPDSMITYAGNNKVAGVVNDRLDKLTPKFATINGVSCVTFTATHFSPYVIYADVNNLVMGATDETPKTGDGIHPKWFLSIGLACLSFVMFMQKDGGKRGRKKQKVRVRA